MANNNKTTPEVTPEVTSETTPEIPVFPATEAVVVAEATKDWDEEAAALFAEHAHIKALYFTADGLAFENYSYARNHAAGLEDKGVKTKISN